MRITRVLGAVGLNFTEQAPIESQQVSLENVPEPLLDQVMLPVGTEPEPWTFALQAVVEPTTTEECEHDTVTLVPRRLLTVSVTGDEATVAPAASFT